MVSDSAVPAQNTYRAEPGLLDLLADIWRAKLFLFIGGVLGAAAAIVFFSLAVPQYKAEMLVGPAERGTGPDIKALLPENSSFAVQYLVNSIGSQDSGDFIRFEHMMRGVSIASLLIQDNAVIAGVRRAGMFGKKEDARLDDAASLAAFLEKHVHVQPVGTSPLRRVVFSHPDPDFAQYLLQQLYVETDALIQQDIRHKTASRAAYLQQAVKDTLHPDHKRALTSLLMEQEHIRMILDMDEPFAAVMLEPPSVDDKPSWPRKKIVWPAFIVLGLFSGFLVFQIRRAVKRDYA